MTAYWTRFENWLLQNAPSLFKLLHPGASQATIKKLEDTIGRKLPGDFVQFYMIHDGQIEEAKWEGLIHGEELMSIEYIIDEWQSRKKFRDEYTFDDGYGPYTSTPDKGIKDDWWNPCWIPITFDGFGDNICIDLDPTPEGQYGQVIRMRHDAADRELLANSFEEYIANYITALEAGEIIYEKGTGLIEKDL